MTTRVELITDQKRLLLIEQQKEKAIHAQHCLTLVEDPQNPDALEAVAASLKTLEVIAKRLEIFESAITGAEVRDAEDVEAARLAKAADARNHAETLQVQQIKGAQDIGRTLTLLSKQLKTFMQMKEDMREAAFTVGKCMLSKDNPRYHEELGMVAALGDVNIASPLAKGLIDAGAETLAGLGELHRYVSPVDSQATVESIVKTSGTRLIDRLDYLLRKGAR